jgi:O-antigen/teichoic acid export membrane protein
MPMLRFRWREIRWGTATELMAFGGWQLAGNVAEMIRTAADPLILNKFATAVDVSCFYLGSLALTNIQQASYLVHRSLGPPLIAMYATGRKDQLRNTYVRGGRYALWLSLLVCVPLMIYGREIIVLWVGDQYAKAATVMTLLLVMFVALYGHAMLGTTAMATGQVRPVMARALGLQIFNLILTLYLVKTRGMGAIGSATATFVTLVLVWPFFNWRLGLRMAELTWQRWLSETFWPGILPGVAAAAVCIALKFAAHPSSWLAVGVCTAGGLATYVIILLVFCLQHQDREELRRIKAILQDWRHRPES